MSGAVLNVLIKNAGPGGGRCVAALIAREKHARLCDFRRPADICGTVGMKVN